MIWRLLVSVLAVSDTGGVAVTSESSNWPTEQQCIEVVRNHYQNPPSQEIGGHRVTMRVAATCVPVDFNVNGVGYVARPEFNQGRFGGPPYTR
jgi:hypothetical protein